MPSNATPSHTDLRALSALPTEALAYVDRLQADSAALHDLTDYSDPGEALDVFRLLSVTVLRSCASEDFRHNADAENHVLALAELLDRIGVAMSYRQQIAA